MEQFMLITSSQNERIKQVRMLQQQGKARRKQQRLVLEGARLMADALDTGAQPDYALHTEEADSPGTPTNALLVRLRDACPVFAITPELMAALSDTETPQGVLGVFPLPELRVPDEPALIVVADGWRDPGNLGTVIRGADAAGADAVLVSDASVDVTSPKVVRSTAGSLFHLPIVTGLDIDATLARLAAAGVRRLAADGAGERTIDDTELTGPHVWVMGNEAWGLPDDDRALADAVVRVPVHGRAESLNLATAAAVCLYASARAQRRGGRRTRA